MAAVDDLSELERVPLFEGLAHSDLERLNELLHRKTYPSATRVISAQEPGEVVYIILEGSVKIHLDRADGSQVTLAYLGPGDTVGEMSLVERLERSANVITLEETTVLWLDRQTFLVCLDEMAQLNRNLVRQLSHRLRHANAKIEALATLDVAGRLARQLLHFAELYGQPGAEGGIRLPLPFTQSDLAEMVGASRERVNRVLGELRESGAITIGPRNHVTVHDVSALERRCR